MALTVEQVTTIRSGLDASGYVKGARDIAQANAQIASSGAQVVAAQQRTTRALVDTESAAARFMARLDPQIRMQQRLAAAHEQMARYVQQGRVAQEAGNAALAVYEARLAGVGTTIRKVAGEAAHLGHASAGITREFIVMGHEMITGRFSRIPGSFLVLGERMGTLRNIIHGVGAAIVSPVGLGALGGAVVVGGLALMAAGAERAANRLHALQNELRATRPDAFGLAPQVLGAAQDVAATSGLSTQSARQFAQEIASAPEFTGGRTQLGSLVRVAANLDAVFGKAGAGAKLLAQALDDPGRVAQQLADRHFPGMSQALAYSLKLMAEGGDRAGAFARDLDVLRNASDGATEPPTRLGRALQDLSNAFTRTGADGRSLADAIGSAVSNAAATALDGISSLVSGMEHLREVAQARAASSGAPGFNPAAGSRAPLGSPTLGPPLANGERAMGLYQVLPSTAQGLGFSTADLATTGGNVAAGAAALMQAYFAANGNVEEALARYGGYGGNVSRAQGYIAKVRAANPAQLDPAVLAVIQREAQSRMMPAALRMAFERLPLVESGGHQFTGASAPAAVPVAPPTPFGPPAPTYDQMLASRAAQGNFDAAFRLYASGGSLSARSAENAAQQQLIERGIAAAQGFGDTASVGRLQEQLAKLRGEATDLISEQQKLARSAQDATGPLAAESGAARALAEVYARFAETARRAGTAIDRGALGAAQSAELAKLSASANDNVAAIERAAAAQERLLSDTARGGQLAQVAAAHEKALADARRTALPGTAEYARQVDALTAALSREARVRTDTQAAASVRRYQQEIEAAREQLALLHATAAERDRQMAMLRERQSLGLLPVDQASPMQQQAIDAAGQATAVQASVQQQQQALTELQSTAQSSFDSLEQALTSPWHHGERAMMRWRTVFDDLTNRFLKMAVTNPLSNLLVGGNAPSIFNGGLFGGGGAGIDAVNGVHGGVGLFGGLLNRFGGAAVGMGMSGMAQGGLFGALAQGISNLSQGFGWGGMASAYAAATGATAANAAIATDASALYMHTGGVVGSAGVPRRSADASLFDNAPRYHAGLQSDEFAAILQRGERVLTANQNARVENTLRAAGGAGGHTFNFNITTPDAQSFSRSQGQIAASTAATLSAVARRA